MSLRLGVGGLAIEGFVDLDFARSFLGGFGCVLVGFRVRRRLQCLRLLRAVAALNLP